MRIRTRTTLAAASSLAALLAISGCAPAAPEAVPTKGDPGSAESTSAAPTGPGTDGSTSAPAASSAEGMSCSNVLTDPASILRQEKSSGNPRVLKAQWTVEGGDYKIIPASAIVYSSGGSKSEYGEHEFPIVGGMRCQVRDNLPSGDRGTIYEYVKFEPSERDGIVEFLRSNGFDETTQANGTVVFSHEFQEEKGEGTRIQQSWHIGSDWLGIGLWGKFEASAESSSFTGEFTDAQNADYLHEDERFPMCSTFFTTFQGSYERLPYGDWYTGFNSMDPTTKTSAGQVYDDYPAEPDVGNGCVGITWHPATPDEIDAVVADLGQPSDETTGSKVYSKDGGAIVVFDSGYAEVDSYQLAMLVREPDLTFRPLGAE